MDLLDFISIGKENDMITEYLSKAIKNTQANSA